MSVSSSYFLSSRYSIELCNCAFARRIMEISFQFVSVCLSVSSVVCSEEPLTWFHNLLGTIYHAEENLNTNILVGPLILIQRERQPLDAQFLCFCVIQPTQSRSISILLWKKLCERSDQIKTNPPFCMSFIVY